MRSDSLFPETDEGSRCVRIAGVDEAGRGPLAGPVVVAAVILDPARPIPGLADSKVLDAVRREQLALLIRSHALAWSVCAVEVGEIDRLNILGATLAGMSRALRDLRPGPALALIDGLRWLERHPTDKVEVQVRFRGFAEREPIPLHAGAAWAERREFALEWATLGGVVGIIVGLLLLLRRYLRRKGLLGNPLSGNIEGQLSNPLVPFIGFLIIVGAATLAVWNLEHDSNARVRTLNDSFWEMNMFATGNFDSESLKTSKARVIGVAATVAGLGLLSASLGLESPGASLGIGPPRRLVSERSDHHVRRHHL